LGILFLCVSFCNILANTLVNMPLDDARLANPNRRSMPGSSINDQDGLRVGKKCTWTKTLHVSPSDFRITIQWSKRPESDAQSDSKQDFDSESDSETVPVTVVAAAPAAARDIDDPPRTIVTVLVVDTLRTADEKHPVCHSDHCKVHNRLLVLDCIIHAQYSVQDIRELVKAYLNYRDKEWKKGMGATATATPASEFDHPQTTEEVDGMGGVSLELYKGGVIMDADETVQSMGIFNANSVALHNIMLDDQARLMQLTSGDKDKLTEAQSDAFLPPWPYLFAVPTDSCVCEGCSRRHANSFQQRIKVFQRRLHRGVGTYQRMRSKLATTTATMTAATAVTAVTAGAGPGTRRGIGAEASIDDIVAFINDNGACDDEPDHGKPMSWSTSKSSAKKRRKRRRKAAAKLKSNKQKAHQQQKKKMQEHAPEDSITPTVTVSDTQSVQDRIECSDCCFGSDPEVEPMIWPSFEEALAQVKQDFSVYQLSQCMGQK
jgi:hypothetical protein